MTVLALALPSSAIAADRYADPDVPVGGGDPDQCLESNPCNVVDAYEGGGIGDVVHLLPGVHRTEESLDRTGVSVIGAGAATTRLEPVGNFGFSGLLLIRAAAVSDVTIDATVPGGTARRALQGSSGVTVQRVVASAAREGCVLLSGTHVVADSICEGSLIGLHVSTSVAIDATLRNVTAIGGEQGLAAAQNGASETTSVEAVNVVAVGGVADVATQTGPNAEGAAVNVDLDFSNFSTTGTVDGPGSESVTAPGASENQTAEPLFVDAGVGDYRQATGSPTIDAGDDGASPSGALDVFGGPRVFGGRIDIGAHEFPDSDGDGVANPDDNCPGARNSGQGDIDGDGEGDACDGDIDGDGTPNGSDAFPADPGEDRDSDGDGIGDNADPTPNGESTDPGGGHGGSDGGSGGDGGDSGGGDGGGGSTDGGGSGGAGSDETGGGGGSGGEGDGAAPRCKGRTATIVGTGRAERIVGTAGDDVIVALGGSDRIRAGGGDDLVCAGGGHDDVRAGAGDDRVLGQGGADVLRGQAGNDVLLGGGGRDKLLGQGGNDRLLGQGGRGDVLVGGGGADRLGGGPGKRDICRGSAGRDRLAGGKRSGCEHARR